MLEVVCGIIHKDHKVFIARKKQGKALAGYWEFPGGKIELGEDPEDALARELREELGMIVLVQKFVGYNTHVYPNVTIKLLAFNCVFKEASLTLIDHDKYKWVNPEELINFKMAPADVPLIKLITKN
ncbi:8-oxo-dGTP diphosphatase [Aquimarina sp. EL_43]|uniref:(deoxy)nucleoside triphosphate pyrophosphohydrolase n=1 Tax=Aquimarina TaxID=290174 RepID=UPI0004710698|nr:MULTISPECIES: (deoxy)nucleoside triphosphate pyrophosphohydrolase [Aquimarina]MBG6131642.1 8-oxo-dGTP diphosphatase [Aquimarina sp. EL_35]MBG6152103.1 8-oxo-dGTP diphosphatase [Aquimarina sp. EL_32]MBG6169953.1 8-oxo-dGTP diphosphatase [Aquimarina sp. EL_43]